MSKRKKISDKMVTGWWSESFPSKRVTIGTTTVDKTKPGLPITVCGKKCECARSKEPGK